ncbi:hypothetical protein DSL72_002788 [Monilinia vaccinii-corymbosi]|uniref:Uncharacterized protein n=1 Tax=Monilinia vaccinii-corymbosi TaxID=61207 RepID=A0A8A3PDE8_9HELO|nr:hypothetical protein DSL72_002788 [Monilinia vaccinii-corymbosi]
MKIITVVSILAATLAVALPAEILIERDDKYCVTQGPGTCTFGWQEFSDNNGHFSSIATIYDYQCIEKGAIVNNNAADQYMTVTSTNPPMTVSINGWVTTPMFDTRATPKFSYNGKTWGGKHGCTCGGGGKDNFWGCRCGFDCP